MHFADNKYCRFELRCKTTGREYISNLLENVKLPLNEEFDLQCTQCSFSNGHTNKREFLKSQPCCQKLDKLPASRKQKVAFTKSSLSSEQFHKRKEKKNAI